MKMKELPMSERPYEKLEMYGEQALSNAELLAIIIKTGTKENTSIELAQKVLNLNNSKENSLRFLQNVSIEELTNIKGIGKVKALQIKAIAEFTKRMSMPINFKNIKIKMPQDVANILMEELKYEKREIVKVIILNIKNIVLKIVNITVGSTNFAVLEPKDVLIEAIKMQAPKIILVHNHPSGNATPSKEDFEITKKIYQCAKLMGIELLDHIVIGERYI
mgnify:FL=1